MGTRPSNHHLTSNESRPCQGLKASVEVFLVFSSPGFLLAPAQHKASPRGSEEVGWEPLLRSQVKQAIFSGPCRPGLELVGRIPSIPSITGLARTCQQLRVAPGWGMLGLLRSYIMRAGLGFAWGSFGLCKGLISRMLLGGFQVQDAVARVSG